MLLNYKDYKNHRKTQCEISFCDNEYKVKYIDDYTKVLKLTMHLPKKDIYDHSLERIGKNVFYQLFNKMKFEDTYENYYSERLMVEFEFENSEMNSAWLADQYYFTCLDDKRYYNEIRPIYQHYGRIIVIKVKFGKNFNIIF